MTRRGGATISLLLTALVLTGCDFTRVDAPIDFRADRRLRIESHESGDEVSLPFTVEWSVEDFDVAEGGRFAVFVDKTPINPRQQLRMRICSRLESTPLTPGEDRKECRDDRERVFLTRDSAMRFDCLESKRSGSDRVKNTHRITVILIGPDGERDGEAGYSVSLRVEEDEALDECNGGFR